MTKHNLLCEISHSGTIGCTLPQLDVPPTTLPTEDQLRDELDLPEVSEVELVRHFIALSDLNYGVDNGFYPLGSCTMKYNPKWHEYVARFPGFALIHPCQSVFSVQGALKIMFELQGFLREITGMDAVCLTPMAGAQGELASALMIKKYYEDLGDSQRRFVVIPDSAHGTNAATSAMAGFETMVIESNREGNIDLDRLRSIMNERVAIVFLTVPTTLGLFDPNIEDIIRIVHEKGAFAYGDGANLNALLGKMKYGEIGFDCVHINLHKTFSTPHGGGGPGAGPICVKSELADYLPSPVVDLRKGVYKFRIPKRSVGSLSTFYGNFSVLVKAYAYIRSLGAAGLKEASENAVINANYIKEKLRLHYQLPYSRPCMHEVVFSGLIERVSDVKTIDIAKRLIDYGFHPPTIYFPIVVDEAMMIEPTETESKETLDNFINAMKNIAEEAKCNPKLLHDAPHNTPVRRLDELTANRNPDLHW